METLREEFRPGEADEISLVDIVRFFIRHGRLITLMTVVLSAIAISFSLLKPQSYQKQLTLSIKPLAVPIPGAIPELDSNQANTLAVEFLQNQPLAQITAQPQYDATTQKISLLLRSPSPERLTTANSEIQKQLQTQFQETLGQTLQTSLTSVEIQLKKNQQVLAQLERQTAQSTPTNEVRQQALETQRASRVANIAELEFDKQYLEQAQENLAEFAAQAISIQILAESNLPPTRSPMPVIIIALIASFMVAVFAAIIIDQIPRLKKDLLQEKSRGSSNV